MSDSVRPHRRPPTRLPRPWDSPGKNTGVGCHFLLQCMKVKNESEVAQPCRTLLDPMDCSLLGFSIHEVFQARVLEEGLALLFWYLIRSVLFRYYLLDFFKMISALFLKDLRKSKQTRPPALVGTHLFGETYLPHCSCLLDKRNVRLRRSESDLGHHRHPRGTCMAPHITLIYHGFS